MNNAIDEHIQNQLPIYLLHLKDMKLLRRPGIKGVLQGGIARFIDQSLPWKKQEQWASQTEGEIRKSAKEWITEQAAYAIFSHRWLDKGELTFQDVSMFDKLGTNGFRAIMEDETLNTTRTSSQILELVINSAYQDAKDPDFGLLDIMKEFCDRMSPSLRESCADLVKIVEFCSIASQHGCHFVWFDTGCIDKSRSAELEESIRSMFSWYRNSKLCIIHLADTTSLETLERDLWFTRGWTLQELLAPKRVLFFGKSWRRITPTQPYLEDNDKVSDDVLDVPLWERISKITGIPLDPLLDFTPGITHARDALIWVSKRRTTRVEDIAYCLIGLLDIPLTIAYGEGNAAFYRLQVEILQRSDDKGLFAWQGLPSAQNSMLAAGPDCFSPLSFVSSEEGTMGEFVDHTHSMTNRGLRIWFPGYNVRVSGGVSVLGVVRHRLEVEDQWNVDVDCDLTPYDLVVVAVLGRSSSSRKAPYWAILLGRREGHWSRVPTQDRIKLPNWGNTLRESKLWFIK